MQIKTVATIVACVLALPIVALSMALTLGGPSAPAPMFSISDPFKQVDFSGLAPASTFTARDGTQLSYRRYDPVVGHSARGSVVLVHGSSADSKSLHPLARSFAQADFTVFALDIRGHGGSGRRGDIDYVGQLDDDLEDFVGVVKPPAPKTLIGFSAGGGFALRVAGGSHQALFDSYLLMAPYTSRHAPNYRPDAGGWVSIGVPRIIGLEILNRMGVTAFNHFNVVKFAVAPSHPAEIVDAYSYALMKSFQPHADYQSEIRNIHMPVAVLDGQNDEVFAADKFKDVFVQAGRADIPVTLVPGAGHISLTLTPDAQAAAVNAVSQLASKLPSRATAL